MQIDGNNVQLSATDLAKHLGCRHATTLDLAAARGLLTRPAWYNALVEILKQRGLEHEEAYLNNLTEQGITVLERENGLTFRAALDWTFNAMKAGAAAIAQACLESGEWHGYADVLLRVDKHSALGGWSYEVVDTKLSRETRGATLLQLSLYSEIVGEMQGLMPEEMHVVKPMSGYEPQSFRTRDHAAYHRFVKRRLASAIEAEQDLGRVANPVEQCEICQWWPKCNADRRSADHLSFVAGIRKVQMAELRRHGIHKLTELGNCPLPLPFKPSRGSAEGYVKLREQARIQLESRNASKILYERLDLDPDHGFARLPEPSPGDIFFDLEADPFIEPDGLEYLFGYALIGADGQAEYRCEWAFDRIHERKAFESFVDMVMSRRQAFPGMHVYHFSPYEPGALKRLMSKYVTREDEIDRMLRAGLLVDLHLVIKQGLRIGVETYSLKELEPLHGFIRATDLREARTMLRRMEIGLETNDATALDPDVLRVVEAYNREDCLSTLALRDWLESVRRSVVDEGFEIARPILESGDPSEKVDAERTASMELMSSLLKEIPEDPSLQTPEQNAQWLLAYMMEWHRRENKAPAWEYFRLCELGDDELIDERNAVSGLKFVERVAGTDRCPIHRYSFPPQETQAHRGGKLKTAKGDLGEIVELNRVDRTIDIRKTQALANEHPLAAFIHDWISSKELVQSLHRIARWVIHNGIDSPGIYRTARDLLLRHPPRCTNGAGTTLYDTNANLVSEARRLALELDHSVLPIQGPPGAGKTFTAARMICELVKHGKKVGITAGSHKVVYKLLQEVVIAADEESLKVACFQKVTDKPAAGNPNIVQTADNKVVLDALQNGATQVAGGTAWLWAREEFFESVDVLFVDEAGQMSLADVIALSPGGKSLVLLGDPQQLEHPLQGTHPPGLAVSALQHIVGDHKTISSGSGLFIEETWRLPPAIQQFTSELFYEDRLKSRPGLDVQRISGPTRFAGAGLWFVPVEHEGNQNNSLEEVERIGEIVAELTKEGVYWTDLHGARRPVQVKDILIVAPYNAQVFAISDRFPNFNVGTVDKFQGQEAAVVIYSMTTSSPEDAPHGMEFLYNTHRLNVATSRARCACILLANPKLFEPECKTPRQMKLANALCRYAELAARVDHRADSLRVGA